VYDQISSVDGFVDGEATVTKGSSLNGSFVATALLVPLPSVITFPITLVLGILGWEAAITVCAVKENSRELP
jgi:hypothetical protein